MSGINYSSVIKNLKISHRGILTWIHTLGGYLCACFDGGFAVMSLKTWVDSVPVKETYVSEKAYPPSTALQKKSKGKYVFLFFIFNC